MKYSAQIEPVKNQLVSAQSILIVMPATTNVDKLASGLALMLALKQAGKQVEVVTEDTLRVSHTNLFGVGEVKNQIVGGSVTGSVGGTFTLTLEGVVDESGNVNSEKLDYYQEGSNLQLIFTIPQGKKFEPTRITTAHSGGGEGGSVSYNMIFVIGAGNLQELGTIYTQNQSLFVPGQLVNIDMSQTNAQYGGTNIVDVNASSVSEMVAQILPDLGLTMTEDTATNLLTGIYDATQNMSVNVKPDTFVAASTAMQAGGKLPIENVANQGFVNQPQQYVQPQQLGVNPVSQSAAPQQQQIPVVMDQPQTSQAQPIPVVVDQQPQQMQNTPPVLTAEPQPQQQSNPGVTIPPMNNSNFDLRQVFNLPFDPVTGQTSSAPQNPINSPVQNQPLPSAEEIPQGEAVTTGNPEVQNPAPDWLVPKIYKSGN